MSQKSQGEGLGWWISSLFIPLANSKATSYFICHQGISFQNNVAWSQEVPAAFLSKKSTVVSDSFTVESMLLARQRTRQWFCRQRAGILPCYTTITTHTTGFCFTGAQKPWLQVTWAPSAALRNEIRSFSTILHRRFLLCSSTCAVSTDLIWCFSCGVSPEHTGGAHSPGGNPKCCPEVLRTQPPPGEKAPSVVRKGPRSATAIHTS